MTRKRKPWLTRPFGFHPVFQYAAAGKPGQGGDKPATPITTQMVGEEGESQPKPGGKTTGAVGEEGPASVPTTTIAKGEEA